MPFLRVLKENVKCNNNKRIQEQQFFHEEMHGMCKVPNNVNIFY